MFKDFIYEDLTFAAKYLPKRWDDATKILGEKLLILDVSLESCSFGECWLDAMLYAQRWKDASDAAWK